MMRKMSREKTATCKFARNAIRIIERNGQDFEINMLLKF